MPEFGSIRNIFSVNKELSTEELLRALRFAVQSEFEAVQLYEQIFDSTSNKLVQETILDIIEEEKKHQGEFLKLLTLIDPNEAKLYGSGANEVKNFE